MRRLVILALFVGCARDHAQQVVNCRVIARTGEALTSCLVLKYDWKGQLAAQEGNRWQAHQDSIAAQIEELRIAALTRENDSLSRVRDALLNAERRRTRADSVENSLTWDCRFVADRLAMNIQSELDAACDSLRGHRALALAQHVAAVDSQFSICLSTQRSDCADSARVRLIALGLSVPF